MEAAWTIISTVFETGSVRLFEVPHTDFESMENLLIGSGLIGLALLLILLVVRRWRSGGDSSAASRESKEAHRSAQQRDPPVEIGGTYELGVTELTDHHTGSEVAVGKVEGFVIFVQNIPKDVKPGDAIKATVTSFNSGHTSADATFVTKK